MKAATPGRVVLYVLNEHDVTQIEHDRLRNASDGNPVGAGDEYPAVVVRAWGALPGSAVNLQVLLDGPDSFWATSRTEGDGPGHWHWPVIA